MKDPKKERTLVIIKPDGVQRALIGEIIRRFERLGLKLISLKMVLANEKQCWEHYNKDDIWFQEKGLMIVKKRESSGLPVEKSAKEYGKDIIEALVSFMTCSPVIPMVWEGNEAIGIIKKIVGGTEPLTSDVGTIRGDFTIDSYNLSNADERAVRNLVHCSDCQEEAEREINLWFKKEEIISYRHNQCQMLYDVNLDGILE